MLVKVRDNSRQNMNEFTFQLAPSASVNVFPQNTLSSFISFMSPLNYFSEEINLEGVLPVALIEIIFPAKINQVNKSDLRIFSSELKFYEKKYQLMLFPDHTEEKKLSLELFL